MLLLVTIGAPLVFRKAGLYARFWNYASVDELVLLATTWGLVVLGATSIAFLLNQVLPVEWGVPRSIPLILLMLGLVATGGPRLMVRVLARQQARHAPYGRPERAIVIVGAGDAGAMIVREMQQNPQLGMQPVAFLDDEPAKHGMVLHGVKVLGDRHQIHTLAKKLPVDEVIIAMPTAPGKEIREIVTVCTAAGVPARILPGVYELLDGKVTVNQLRNVQIEDLLRRTPVQTDTARVRQLLAGRRVLITGGGGSIGSELARQVCACEPAALYLLGHGENSIFEAIQELRARRVGVPVEGIIADIRFSERLHQVMAEAQPEIIFHAAAHKHVPLMEVNPSEAVLNNVIGTRNVLDAAVAVGVQRLVMISTDKAVNPTNMMGVTKRVAELLVHQAAEKTGLPYVAVRFGNVLGSRGSVLHTFRRQIAAGGPVTVTHPEMERFFMTIPEAVQLVLQASVLGQGGEVFVLDMGQPVRIVDLARDLIRLSGLEEGRDIDLAYIGLRPGEKLYEELFVAGEAYQRTEHHQIFIARNASNFVPAQLDAFIEALHQAALTDNRAAMATVLHCLAPEYHPAPAAPGNGAQPAIAALVANASIPQQEGR
jgi:FlaA1/EpsC-like NDP-sugar epimerase